MSRRAKFIAIRLAASLPFSGPAAVHAAPSGDGDGSAEAKGGLTLDRKGLRGKAKAGAKGDQALSTREDRPWIQRWAPERNTLELGVFGGMLVPARDLELFEPRATRPRQGFVPLARVAPDVGIRLGYFPLRYLGLEAEGATMPTTTLEDGYAATMFSVRAHVMGQLPFGSVAPFALIGAGALGIRSNPEIILGQDVDPAIHLGLGSKFYINRRIMARLDLRDIISPRRGVTGSATNTIEVLLGLSIVLGRERDVDREPEPEPEPEPAPSDRDEDGFLDDEDTCPDEAGVAPDGCPVPPDRDEDGFLDDEDACPDEAGIEPDGCPDRDADGDGILTPDDLCPDVPETINGFEDADGCADEVPEEVQRFSGRLEGINFELGKARLTADSLPVLDEAVEVLLKYTDIRLEISGHTDNSGPREVNMQLSQERADAVKQYLVDKGVDEGRITTRGAGPDEPIDTNVSREGRANNRRIEFRILE